MSSFCHQLLLVSLRICRMSVLGAGISSGSCQLSGFFVISFRFAYFFSQFTLIRRHCILCASDKNSGSVLCSDGSEPFIHGTSRILPKVILNGSATCLCVSGIHGLLRGQLIYISSSSSRSLLLHHSRNILQVVSSALSKISKRT